VLRDADEADAVGFDLGVRLAVGQVLELEHAVAVLGLRGLLGAVLDRRFELISHGRLLTIGRAPDARRDADGDRSPLIRKLAGAGPRRV
jgi:hypothetical protein